MFTLILSNHKLNVHINTIQPQAVWSFPDKLVCEFLFSSVLATLPPNTIPLVCLFHQYLVEYELLCSSMWNYPQPLLTYTLARPDILLNILFSDTTILSETPNCSFCVDYMFFYRVSFYTFRQKQIVILKFSNVCLFSAYRLHILATSMVQVSNVLT
jgi:hypothetical protein